MPRGFKFGVRMDWMQDPASFLSQPKAIKGENMDGPAPHLLLGPKDKGRMRVQIFLRNRQKHGGINRCDECSHPVIEFKEDIFNIQQRPGEWDHIRNQPGTRCDCIDNARVLCGGREGCHSKRHLRPRFGPSKIV